MHLLTVGQTKIAQANRKSNPEKGMPRLSRPAPPQNAVAIPTVAPLKTLFTGSGGTIPESYARTVDKPQLTAWIKEGLIAHRRTEKLYALTPKGEARIR